MAKKSWHLDRRTMLRGTGAAVALPLLNSMLHAGENSKPESTPRRMFAGYFPFGAQMRDWTPKEFGSDFTWSSSLEPLAPLKQDVSVLTGMLHPAGLTMGGHRNSHIFLSGQERLPSIDQYVAARFGSATRFPSLTLSSDGGVGSAVNLPHTLSFAPGGRAVPALHQPRTIFNEMFVEVAASDKKRRREELSQEESILDLVGENARSLRNKLGKEDQRKFDEYLASVREVESGVERAQDWLDKVRPDVNTDGLDLDANYEGPKAFIRTMYDLVYLAFQTDSTRVATYMLGSMKGSTSVATKFPACIGMEPDWHRHAHGGRTSPFDRYLVGELSHFMQRLKSTPEGDGNMLDHTLVLYGSSNSRTHVNSNYPLVVAGGGRLGVKHGRHIRAERVPMSNLFVTMLNSLGIESKQYADSTGVFSQLTENEV